MIGINIIYVLSLNLFIFIIFKRIKTKSFLKITLVVIPILIYFLNTNFQSSNGLSANAMWLLSFFSFAFLFFQLVPFIFNKMFEIQGANEKLRKYADQWFKFFFSYFAAIIVTIFQIILVISKSLIDE
jgi:hypothetical protein